MAYQIYSHTLPSATPGTQRAIKVHHFGERGARPKVYLQAGLHADEWPGFLVLNELLKKLKQVDEEGLIKGEIVVVPVANPIGLSQNFHCYIPGRFAFSEGGGNFNRNWPQLGESVEKRVRSTISQDQEENIRLVRAAIKDELIQLGEQTELQGLKKTLLALSMDADEVLDLHCSGEACMHAYVAQEFEEHFRPLLNLIGAKVALSELETGAHSFDETNVSVWRHLKAHFAHLVPWGARSLTLELRGENDISKAYAEQDAQALYDYFVLRDVVETETGENKDTVLLNDTLEKDHKDSVVYYPLDAMDLVKAPCAGIVCYEKNIGDNVEAGEVIGDVVSLTDDDVDQSSYPLVARTNGVLFARLQRRLVIRGESIAKIAGKEHLAYREVGHLFEDK
ncbi:succinylglutamate desuccinylase/aspartoacylase family protein [Marinomonas mediterranea]|jgi:Predicted deacylase|uniref:Succinylglutamate desuccinylase/aspartoacylase n=1 Tax=Marinomonas mediterranea (strain ATCC 700492 / JCM 21426 / NBRC 103028 / MMB-1) TaxID=717774 RepID=F2K262_MARM1|nr:succinylglutamate desuccinylase/aspartoacylase family protein [Marinomonas mediterranea]ADZ91140.1 Succinylglutamate desuccinylase/aspartoacylase [Marinomonas mediterranea MMB-1]WCN17271.1 succinylglutamate desuccinylase [Marinomonas mediterranea MMB-1]